jgi:O-acetyl-ADP-ribose deacetylase (regulator of RNase III)
MLSNNTDRAIGSFIAGTNTGIWFKKGDITHSKHEAIVNAANEQLAHGAGVCGAIFAAAGADELQKECDAYPVIDNNVRCPVGQARVTSSCNLKKQGIQCIIHAVGPDCRIIKDTKKQDALLRDAYYNSLLLADEQHVTSIAFPFISSAIYAFPKERAAQIAVDTVREYICAHRKTCVTSVTFILFSQADFDLFAHMPVKK